MRRFFILLLLFILPAPASAQAFQCPAGSVQVSGGGGIMCQCPDGSFAGISGCPNSQSGRVSNSCADLEREKQLLLQQWEAARGSFATNPYGGAESNWQTRLARLQQLNAEIANCQRNSPDPSSPAPVPTPQNQFPINCGNYSCRAGFSCGSANSCLTIGSDDCGSGRSCPVGSSCSRDSQHCVPAGGTDCGSFTCGAGSKCPKRGASCLSNDAVDCGTFICSTGSKCGSGNRCFAQNEVDCGAGKSCPVGNVCVNGGSECLTKEQLTKRIETEKLQKADEARRVKEAKEAEAWLKKEQVRLAKETAEKNKPEDASAKKTKEQTKNTKTATPSTKNENTKPPGAQSTPGCATAIQQIDAIAIGKALPPNVPDCSRVSASPPSGSPIQQGTANTLTQRSGGAVLNPNLKDIQSLQPPPPAEAPQQSISSAPYDYFGSCSTFTLPDGANAGPNCPIEPGPVGEPADTKSGPQQAKADPFGPPSPEQEAKRAEDEEKQRQAEAKKILKQVTNTRREEYETCSKDWNSWNACSPPGLIGVPNGKWCKVCRRSKSCNQWMVRGVGSLPSICATSWKEEGCEPDICKSGDYNPGEPRPIL